MRISSGRLRPAWEWSDGKWIVEKVVDEEEEELMEEQQDSMDDEATLHGSDDDDDDPYRLESFEFYTTEKQDMKLYQIAKKCKVDLDELIKFNAPLLPLNGADELQGHTRSSASASVDAGARHNAPAEEEEQQEEPRAG